MAELIADGIYSNLLNDIGSLLDNGRKSAVQKINTALVETCWQIGYRIVEFEQQGNEKAGYGSVLLKQLSRDLKLRYGKGFSRSNLQYMRLLYLKYPICQTLSGKLSWSQYCELLSVSDDLARSFPTSCLFPNTRYINCFKINRSFCIPDPDVETLHCNVSTPNNYETISIFRKKSYWNRS